MRTTSASNLSDHVGSPNGRRFPFFFGMKMRRTGRHFHRSRRTVSMSYPIFIRDIPSTVSPVTPGVIAPAFEYNFR
jgi:hypothetical protein